MPKYKETLCEVCGKPVDLLSDYADLLSDTAFTPREYIEHQLNMTEEEKEVRKRFFEEMWAEHNKAKRNGS